MARPQNLQALSGAQSTGPGELHRQRGYPNVSLVVVASNLDAANDTLTVELQHSPRGERWETLGEVTEAEFENGVASVRLSNVALEHLRANVETFSDASGGDLAVDAYLLLNGNFASSASGREV